MTFNKLWPVALAVAAFVTPAAHAELIFGSQDLGSDVLVQAMDVGDAAGFDTSATRMQIGGSLGVDLGVTASNGSLSVGSNFGVWGLGSNGEWTDTTNPDGSTSTFLAIDGGADAATGTYATLSFDFGSQAVSAVGAFISYDPDFSYFGTPIQLYIAAYDSSNNLIEDYTLPFAAVADENGYVLPNQGAFYGIKLDNASIARFEVSAPYAVVDNFSFTTPVPEPSAYALLGLGAGVMGLALRRRRAA